VSTARLDVAGVTALLERSIDLSTRPAPAALDRVVADLAGLGLPPGTPVVISLSNGRRFLEVYFAALLTGAVPVPVSPATTSARISGLSRELGAGAVVGARLDPARYGATTTAAIGDVDAVRLPAAGARNYPQGTVLMLTSGTSGMYSACLHRVDSLLRNAGRHAAAVGLRSDDTILVNLPLFYSYAIVAQALAAFVTGARLVLSGPPFAAPDYLAAIARHGVTASSVTPTIARLLLAHGAPLPKVLRMLTVGGDSIDAARVGALLAANPLLELFVTYGLTEAGPRVSTLAAHAEPASRHASVGLPLPGVSTTLRRTGDRELPDGTGELLVSSPDVLLAKLGGGSAGRTLSAPGVVATGDLFRVDDGGYLYFTGRLSDFVVVRGEKVSLSAVRGFVQALPGVVGCRTVLDTDPDGTVHFDLDVSVAADGIDAEPDVRRAIRGFLLAAERPRRLTVAPVDLAVFRK